jgi:hypothetical protein
MDKRAAAIFCILIISLLVLGCSQQFAPPAKEMPAEADESAEDNESEAGEEEEAEEFADIELEEEGPESVEAEPEEIVVEPVREKARYEETAPEPTKQEKDTCGYSFRWDPVCGKDGKIYLNRCLFQCFGNDLEEIEINSQCPKKESPIDIYVDDMETDYETDKWNGGYCWRQMYRESGIRYCKNLLVNGRINTAPEPARGNWLDEEHLVLDKGGRKDSHAIRLETGEQVSNEEFDMLFQPLFEEGRYKFSFWARQDIAANNDWQVKLVLKDWWDKKPRPVGVTGCYEVSTDINADEHFIEELPNKWRHYHYEFDVPLELEQWSSYERAASECEYEWDMTPHGYRLELTGPTIGYAMFEDFVLEKIK